MPPGTRFIPFPGLRPFEPDEDHLFFGREKEIDDLLRRLHSCRFLSVVGTSGSGKSSLVRSGLIPSLHSGFMVTAGSNWRVATFRPGGDPIGNLALVGRFRQFAPNCPCGKGCLFFPSSRVKPCLRH